MSPQLRALLSQALLHHQAGALADSERLYREILASQPDSGDAWNLLATCLYQQGRLEEAGAASGSATSLRPGIAAYWVTRGNIAAQAGDDADAEASFRRACDLDPDLAQGHHGLARVLLRAERLHEAFEEFAQAFQRDPEGRLDRGECFQRFAQLRFDELPPFWHAELLRLLARDRDPARFHAACLSVLRATPAFRSALQAAAAGGAPQADGRPLR